MKKILFLDRDGTIITEPKDNQQIDSLEKLEFIPEAITALSSIASELDFLLVMVTNQDGLGTDTFPEESFWPAHNKMMHTLLGEGIEFADVLIDRSFEKDKLDTRKPGIGMLKKYMVSDYDLANSYVIGDRLTDVELAKNLGSKAIFFGRENCNDADLSTNSWRKILKFLRDNQCRTAKVKRKTSETEIVIELNIDGTGEAEVCTGIGFFDHMLCQIAKHAKFDMRLSTKGDLHVDEHHTVEDTALALGEALDIALGDKRGIKRFGFLLPMDDCLAQVALDFSGRSYLVWEAEFKREKVGELPTEMFSHFFRSFCDAARCTLNIKAEGLNEHHKIEAIFKAFAKVLGQAVTRDGLDKSVPSTKGIL